MKYDNCDNCIHRCVRDCMYPLHGRVVGYVFYTSYIEALTKSHREKS